MKVYVKIRVSLKLEKFHVKVCVFMYMCDIRQTLYRTKK
jgi:hypothetical protein